MALDLYINNERFSNNSTFYRLVSSNGYTFNVKLSDKFLPNENLSQYYVEYTFNNTLPRVLWNADENGFFTLQRSINRTVACVSSIQVYVSGAELFPVAEFQLSGVFVSSFPRINYIAYPSFYVNTDTADYATITSANYTLSSRGLYFYGEGHTEVINLSSNNYDGSGNTMNWLIGNTITDLLSSAKANIVTSKLPAVSASSSTATLTLSSQIGNYPKYPVSLWATNSKITTRGPIITYRDSDGVAEYYPFFTSSLSANDVTENNTKFKSAIRVLPYPESKASVIVSSPFKDSYFYLPFSYSNVSFTTVSDVENILGDALTEVFVGTKWEVEGTSRSGDWSVQTDFLSSVFAYKFDLSYEQDTGRGALFPLKASAVYPTAVTINLTSSRSCKMELPTMQGIPAPPQDWGIKLVPVTNSLSAVVNQIPFNRIYTPNYYNVKGEDVSFTIISTPEPPYTIERLTLQSANSPDTLVLANSATAGTMTFNVLGVVDLSATALLRNNISGAAADVTLIYQDLIEIVANYDDPPKEQFFATISSPLNLTYSTQPRVSPNEWAVADNVNSIIEKFYVTIEELVGRSRVYSKRSFLYGYLEPAEKVSILQVPEQFEWYSPPRVWLDLDCTDGTVTDDTAAWFRYESNFAELSSTWDWQNCGERIKIDPSCYQKYCIQWNWRWRVKGASEVDVTWADTKSTNVFAKKWKWQKCTIDAVNINCDRTKWNISTIDVDLFPLPVCSSVDRCTIVDAEVSKQTDQIVVAHKTEIHLIDKDYYCNHVARNGMADDLFSFQNIVGLATSNQGKLAVLDSTIPRVSIYTIDKNNFTPFSNWGSFGLIQTPQGLRNPLDIHVDKYDSIWIADTGNNCIKKFTLIGKPLLTITHELLDETPPISVCVDSIDNVHCLTSNKVVVFDKKGNYVFAYDFDSTIDGPVSKINVSYNKEMIYITYLYGVAKHFRTGLFCEFVIRDIVCKDGYYFEGYNSVAQDEFRNVYVTAKDKIMQIADLQEIVDLKSPIPSELYWSLDDLKIHKEEYIQPWVYLKAFHRLWDNIELMKNSIFYVPNNECKSFVASTYSKEDLIIGQNEIVTNAVINRLSEQLWSNLQSLINYFDPDCEN
jgi:hypothetical protein